MAKYEFRKLKATDLTLILKLVSKIGLDNFAKAYEGGIDKFVEAQVSKNAKKDKEEFAIELGKALFLVAQVIIERLSVCEGEIIDLLEACSNLSREEIEDLSPVDYIKMIKEFILQEEFKELFTEAMSLLGMAK